ncbi:MAG: hypothetical protein WDW38_007721 [Sanguina aurantia]
MDRSIHTDGLGDDASRTQPATRPAHPPPRGQPSTCPLAGCPFYAAGRAPTAQSASSMGPGKQSSASGCRLARAPATRPAHPASGATINVSIGWLSVLRRGASSDGTERKQHGARQAVVR